MKLLKTIVFLSAAALCVSANAEVAKKDAKSTKEAKVQQKETKAKSQQPQKESKAKSQQPQKESKAKSQQSQKEVKEKAQQPQKETKEKSQQVKKEVNEKPQQTEKEVASKPEQPVKDSTPKVLPQTQEQDQVSDLQKFAEAVSLRFIGVDLSQQENDQMITFKYQLENKSDKEIQAVHWIVYYTRGNEILLTRDIPAVFDKALVAGQVLPVELSFPWESLSQDMKDAILDQKQGLSSRYQAKSIEFTDGSKIIVK